MKSKSFWTRAALTAVAATALAACGGGDGPVSAVDATPYASALGQSNTAAGLGGAVLKTSFASSYVDAGMTQAQLMDALGNDAAGFGSPDYSGLPGAALTDVAVGNCNASNVCTLSGTITNSDADATSVPFSTQVVLEGGSYRVLGDQKAG